MTEIRVIKDHDRNLVTELHFVKGEDAIRASQDPRLLHCGIPICWVTEELLDPSKPGEPSLPAAGHFRLFFEGLNRE